MKGLLYLDFTAFLPNITHIRKLKFTAIYFVQSFEMAKSNLFCLPKDRSVYIVFTFFTDTFLFSSADMFLVFLVYGNGMR